jgi:hypothetical protein
MPGSTASASSSRAPGALLVGVNWIGDAIMAMPALQAWRRAHPGHCELTLLVKQGPGAPCGRCTRRRMRVLTYRDGLGAALRAAAAVRAVGAGPRLRVAAFLPLRPGAVPRRRAGTHRPARATRRDFLLTQRGAAAAGAGPPAPGFRVLATCLLSGPDATSLEPPALDIPAAARAAAQPWVAPLPRPLLGLLPGPRAVRPSAGRCPMSASWPGAGGGNGEAACC